jgi:ankyrin repeat protein
MPPAGGFGGFQAHQPQSAQIDASTPWVAAGDGDLHLLQTSITQLGLAPNAADSNGFTFLHAACGYGRIEVIQWLLGLNRDSVVIDVNAKDGDGDTPLHHCDDVDSAKLLIEAGADHTIKNDEGKTALEVKKEDVQEGDEEDDSDDEDREKLKELVEYLTTKHGGIVE